MAVVGTQAAAAVVHFLEDGQQVDQVVGGTAFPQEHVHAAGHLLLCFCHGDTFVVIGDAGGDIGVQVPARESRCMTVDDAVLERRQLVQDLQLARDDPHIVHHFRQSPHARIQFPDRLHVGCRQNRARCVQIGRRYAARHVDVHGKGHVLRFLQEELNPRNTEDIGDFMGIREHGRDPVQQQDFGEFARRQHGAFQVYVGIHEARRHILAVHIDFPPAFILPDTDDAAAPDGDIGRLPGLREYVEDLSPFQDQVGFPYAFRRGDIRRNAGPYVVFHTRHLIQDLFVIIITYCFRCRRGTSENPCKDCRFLV